MNLKVWLSFVTSDVLVDLMKSAMNGNPCQICFFDNKTKEIDIRVTCNRCKASEIHSTLQDRH